MGDSNKSGFSFQPASGTSSTPSAFGGFGKPAASAEQSKPLFGGPGLFGGANTNTQTTAAPTSLFGAATTTSQAPSLFGSGSGNTTTAAAPSLFGGGAAAPATSSSLFGAPSSAVPSATTTSNLFGGNAATSGGFSFGTKAPASATTPATSMSLFGNVSTAPTSSPAPATSNLFGGPPAAATPNQNSIFASAAKMPATGGLFSNLNKPQADAGTPQAKPPAALSFTPAGKPPAASTGGPGLFGNMAGAGSTTPAPGTNSAAPSVPTSAGLFGAKPAESSTSAAGPGLFGAKPAAAGTASSGAGLFGAKPENTLPALNLGATTPGKSLFGEVKAADKPAAPSLFGATPASTQAGSTATAAPSLFGAATTKASAPSLFPTSTATQSSATPATTAPALSGGLFSLSKPTATTTANPSSTTTTTTAPTLGGLFGAAQAASQHPAAAAAASTTATAAPAATSTAGASLFGASVGNPPAAANATIQQPSSRLTSKSLDEIITTWSTSLATHQKTFANVAERVARWDRQLVHNSSAIGGLYSRVFQAERDTAEVERQLSNVEAGQRELDARLAKYEAEVDGLLNAAGLGDDGAAGGVDNEREQTYNAAEECQSRLTDMGQNLTAMIEEINLASNKLSASKKNSNTEDPLAQIVRVLNAHLAQLQTIDKGAQSLTLKVEQAQKDTRVLSSRTNGLGGKDWVDGFGRSYLGRK